MDLFFMVVGCSITSFVVGIFTGANDVANSLSTSVGSGSISYKYALFIVFIFEIIGATLLGSSVTNFMKNKIMILNEFKNEPEILAIGMLSCSISISIWLIGATYAKLPVSTTHSIIGSLVGFGITSRRCSSINWFYVLMVFISWILVPFFTVILSCICYIFMLWLISNFSKYFNKFIIIFCSLACLPFSFFLVFKHPFIIDDLKTDVPYSIYFLNKYKIAIFILTYIFFVLISTIFVIFLTKHRIASGYKYTTYSKISNKQDQESQETNNITITHSATSNEVSHPSPEIMLSSMQVIGIIFKIISHASNDSANAATPVAIILSIYLGEIQDKFTIPWYILFLAGLSMSIGLLLFGGNIMNTVSYNLTTVVPSKGYVIDSVVSSIILFFSFLGLPLSSTHCLVSAIFGTGLVIPNFFEGKNNEDLETSYNNNKKPPANILRFCGLYKIFSLEQVNLTLFKKIFIAWIITILFSSLCSSFVFLIFKLLILIL